MIRTPLLPCDQWFDMNIFLHLRDEHFGYRGFHFAGKTLEGDLAYLTEPILVLIDLEHYLQDIYFMLTSYKHALYLFIIVHSYTLTKILVTEIHEHVFEHFCLEFPKSL